MEQDLVVIFIYIHQRRHLSDISGRFDTALLFFQQIFSVHGSLLIFADAISGTVII
jgi:hypothetical protein